MMNDSNHEPSWNVYSRASSSSILFIHVSAWLRIVFWIWSLCLSTFWIHSLLNETLDVNWLNIHYELYNKAILQIEISWRSIKYRLWKLSCKMTVRGKERISFRSFIAFLPFCYLWRCFASCYFTDEQKYYIISCAWNIICYTPGRDCCLRFKCYFHLISFSNSFRLQFMKFHFVSFPRRISHCVS